MARRGYSRTRQGVGERDGKNMLGSHLPAAKSKVNRLARNVIVASLRDVPFKASDVLNWTIKPEHQQILRDAVGVVDYYASSMTVDTQFSGVSLVYDFAKMSMARAESDILHTAEPLTALAQALQRIAEMRRQWVNVMAVMHYFDRYGTPGSARYYWPTLCTLAPEHPQLQEAGLGNSFIDPQNYPAWLPLMRATATTVASALMLPPCEDTGSMAIQISLPEIVHEVLGESVAFGGMVVPLCD